MHTLMRYERLILTSGDQAVTLRFHSRFTVIAGVGQLEREGIAGELLGALRGPRPGTNLEVVTDSGRRIGLLRPGWGVGDRALDIDTGEELTETFTTPDGRLDLLAPYGLNLVEARRLARFGALDVMGQETQGELVRALATQPQGELWRAAERLAAARQRLDSAATNVGATPEDTALIAEVDARHQQFESAQDRCESIRHHGVFTGGACAIGGIPAVVMNRWAALPFAFVAAAFLLVGVVFRRRMEQARIAEDDALAAAGAASYGGFLHQRVAAMIGVQDAQRREISGAVEEHRKAQVVWTKMVGDVDLEWALQHQAAIAAAAGSAGDREAAAMALTLVRARQPNPAELAAIIDQRAAALLSVGMEGESLPMIFDEPFEGLDLQAKRWLLEQLVRMAGRPQLVLLTSDEEIMSWARGAESAGDVAVRELAPGRVERHLAAVG